MALTDRDTSVSYVGELFLVGAFQTPFLNMAGGLNGTRAKQTRSLLFPVAQPWALAGASQPAIDEDTSAASVAANTYARSQDTNTVQIFQRAVEVTYLRQSTYGEITPAGVAGENPVTDEFAFQKSAALRQIALDADYSMLNGAYQAAANSSTAAKMRGVVTAVTTNTTAAGSVKLSKSLINGLLKKMADAGAPFENVVCFVNAYQKQVLSDLYGYAPEDRNVGGVNVKTIETDFAQIGVVYAPNMVTSTLLLADMNYVYPVFCPVPGKGLLFYEDLARVSGSQKGQFYGLIGIDYGPEEYHGTITGLTTS